MEKQQGGWKRVILFILAVAIGVPGVPRIAARLRAACDDRGPHARPRQAISANIDCPSGRFYQRLCSV
jgi:hypothetical protein